MTFITSTVRMHLNCMTGQCVDAPPSNNIVIPASKRWVIFTIVGGTIGAVALFIIASIIVNLKSRCNYIYFD